MGKSEDPRGREASRRLAEELEATGIALSGDVGVEMLVRAADIRHTELDDPHAAMVLLRRVLKDAPRSRLALGRALHLATSMGAHEDLAELLALAANATDKASSRARLVVRRADVLATKLGRIAEARSAYRDAARLSPHTPLSADATAAAERIDHRLEAEREGRDSDVEMVAVEHGALRFEESVLAEEGDPDEALERLRVRIGARAPLDETLILEAVQLGLSKGLYDVAARVLPWMSSARRVAVLDEIATGADGAQDPTSARDARAAAFVEAPEVDAYFDAMIAIVREREDEEGLARAIERHAAADGPDGLLELTEEVKRGARRIRVLVELVRNAESPGALDETLERSEILANELGEPRTVARVLAAGASHAWLPGPDRGAILLRLARLLRTALDDNEGARVVEREAKAMMVRSGPDTMPDRPSPLYRAASNETTDGPDAPVDDEAETIDVTTETADDAAAVESAGPTRRSSSAGESDPGSNGAGDVLDSPTYDEGTIGADTARSTEALADEVASMVADRIDPLTLARSGRIVEAVAALDRLPADVRVDVSRIVADLAGVAGLFEPAASALNAGWAVAESPEARETILAGAATLATRGGPWCAAILDDGAPPAAVGRAIGLAAYARGDHERAARHLEPVVALDPGDEVAARALLASVDAARAAELAEKLPAAKDVATKIVRARQAAAQNDESESLRMLFAALDTDPCSVEAARAAFEIASRTREDALVDDALRRWRIACFERQERSAAFLVSAVLVARSADEPADRMTYEAYRHELRLQPRAALPKGYLADLEAQLTPTLVTPSDPPPTAAPLSVLDGALEAIDAVRAAFRMLDVEVRQAEGDRVQASAGPPRWVAIPAALAAYPRRLRFELGRGMAALADPRLHPALDFVQEHDEAPPAAVKALDRAGLIAVGDPALALAEVGPRTARGLELTSYALSEALLGVWAAMGIGLA